MIQSHTVQTGNLNKVQSDKMFDLIGKIDSLHSIEDDAILTALKALIVVLRKPAAILSDKFISATVLCKNKFLKCLEMLKNSYVYENYDCVLKI